MKAAKLTRLQRLEAFFRARPNQWIDGLTLAPIAGAYAWRTRLSECRRVLGMNIENQQHAEGERVVSLYRYVPSDVLPGWPADGLTIIDEAQA